MRLSCTLLMALLATGCATGPAGGPQKALEGATLVVQREISVPVDSLYVWFQRGTPGRHHTEFWAPYCKLRVGGNTNETRVVEPGRFAVRWTRYQYTVGQHGLPVLASRDSRRVASRGIGADVPDADPMFVEPQLVLGLHASEQPRVQRLTCGVRRGTITLRDPPSLDAMEEALGEYADIEPAG